MSKRSREQCAEDDGNETEEDEDLKQAIALSLQQRTPPAKKSKVEPIIVVDDDDTEEDEDLKRAILESLKYSSSTTTKKSPQKEKIASQKDTRPNIEKQSINSNPNSANNSSPFKLNFIEGMEAT